MSTYKWKQEHRDPVRLEVPKGSREKLKRLAEQQGKESTARLIKDALYYYMDAIGVDRINLE